MTDPEDMQGVKGVSVAQALRQPWRKLRAGLLRRWPAEAQARALMAGYRRAGWATRWEQELRLRICPFEEVIQRVPKEGIVLDLGCGFGALSHLLAMDSAQRRVIGIEQMAHRVEVARRAIGGLSNLEFLVGDIHKVAFVPANCIIMNDVLHHIPHDRQIPLLKKCYEGLLPGGSLLIKDVTKSPVSKYIWNYIHDFLRNGNLPFYCLDAAILHALLGLVGFVTTMQRLDEGYPYPHILYVCNKPATGEGQGTHNAAAERS